MQTEKFQDTVSQQAGDPGEPMVWFWSESKGLGTKRLDGIVPAQRLTG